MKTGNFRLFANKQFRYQLELLLSAFNLERLSKPIRHAKAIPVIATALEELIYDPKTFERRVAICGSWCKQNIRLRRVD